MVKGKAISFQLVGLVEIFFLGATSGLLGAVWCFLDRFLMVVLVLGGVGLVIIIVAG
jgi:hypothetical protein